MRLLKTPHSDLDSFENLTVSDKNIHLFLIFIQGFISESNKRPGAHIHQNPNQLGIFYLFMPGRNELNIVLLVTAPYPTNLDNSGSGGLHLVSTNPIIHSVNTRIPMSDWWDRIQTHKDIYRPSYKHSKINVDLYSYDNFMFLVSFFKVMNSELPFQPLP